MARDMSTLSPADPARTRGGILVLDKRSGPTSHDLVAVTRRALGTRKVGHAGTLDPMASGVMVLGVGPATRLLTFIVGADKTYLATIRLGQSTTTEDAEGEITAQAPADRVDALDEGTIRAAMLPLTGGISQIPSAVSAIKVDGVRAYQRVRAGEQVELAAREVTIHGFELLELHRPAPGLIDLRVRVDCSSGTYIRALARDLGAALGVGGHLTALRRTRVGGFQEREAADAGDPELADRLLDPAAAAARVLPTLRLDRAQTVELRHGRTLAPPPDLRPGPSAAIDPAGRLIGIVQLREGRLRPIMNLPQEGET